MPVLVLEVPMPTVLCGVKQLVKQAEENIKKS